MIELEIQSPGQAAAAFVILLLASVLAVIGGAWSVRTAWRLSRPGMVAAWPWVAGVFARRRWNRSARKAASAPQSTAARAELYYVAVPVLVLVDLAPATVVGGEPDAIPVRQVFGPAAMFGGPLPLRPPHAPPVRSAEEGGLFDVSDAEVSQAADDLIMWSELEARRLRGGGS